MSLDSAIEATLRRERLLVLSGLVVISALAWTYMLYLAWEMKNMEMGMEMAHPRMHVWGGVDFILMFVMWAVMMVAMMIPSAAPMILLFAKVHQKHHEQQKTFLGTGMFLLGYLIVWTGLSAVATVAQWGLHTAALLSSMMVSTSSFLGGSLLIAAGIFQFTPSQKRLFGSLPLPFRVFHDPMADGNTGGPYHGTPAWELLRGLLLVTDGPPFCSRGHELALGSNDNSVCLS